MLLSELADATGTSAASIKYYLREGLLPAGRRVTATRADYGERHVERLHLIRTLRETCATPIPHIAGLTALLDADPVPLLDAMELAQLLALGFDPGQAITVAGVVPEPGTRPPGTRPSHGGPPEPGDDPAADAHDPVGRVLTERGWPVNDARVRGFLEELLVDMARDGHAPLDATLNFYARIADEVAAYDLGVLESSHETPDRIVAGLVVGTARYSALLVRMVALAHASRSIARHHRPPAPA